MIRALALLLALWAGPALAHGLPGSTVTLQAEGQGVTLTLTLPLPELELAMEGGSGLGPDPAPGPLEPDARDRLAAYLARHVALGDSALRLASARIEMAEDHHAGPYRLLVVEMTAAQARLPLRLRFDAILHEVRSHRVRVLVQAPGQAPRPLARLRPDPGGKPPELEIEALP